MATLKTVSVSSQLLGEVVPYQMTFLAIDERAGNRLRLPYNPESYEIRVAPRWSPRGGAGAEVDGSDWEGNTPRTLSYSHLLTAQNVPGPLGGDVESVIQQFDTWATRPTLATQRPTRLRVTAGDGLHFVGVISSVTYRRVRVTAAGLALTAEFDVELMESDRG